MGRPGCAAGGMQAEPIETSGRRKDYTVGFAPKSAARPNEDFMGGQNGWTQNPVDSPSARMHA